MITATRVALKSAPRYSRKPLPASESNAAEFSSPPTNSTEAALVTIAVILSLFVGSLATDLVAQLGG